MQTTHRAAPEGYARPEFDFERLGLGQHRAACPQCVAGGHSPRKRNLSVHIDPDGAMWHCHRCGWEGGSRSRTSSTRIHQPRQPQPKQAPRADALKYALRIWNAAQPITSTLGEKYLRSRQCVVPPPEGHLRFVPSLRHGPSGQDFPALVALVTDALTGEPMTLHRTYLAHDGSGKAPVDPARLLMKDLPKRGGVIRLWPDDEVTHGLAITEGIETALTAAHAFEPVWACIDAGNMAELPVLPGVSSLTIVADHDRAGSEKANACARRWVSTDREVFIWRSEHVGFDLNDEVLL